MMSDDKTNTWQVPCPGEQGDPVPAWLSDAVRRREILKMPDGSAMVPKATAASCIAKHGDRIVRSRGGSIDIEPAEGAARRPRRRS